MAELSVREKLLSTLFTTLQTVTHSKGAVEFSRNIDAPISSPVGLVMFDGEQESDPGRNFVNRYSMTIYIDGHVVAGEGGPLLNELYAATFKALVKDQTVGGYAIRIFESGLDVSLAEGEGGATAMQFNAVFVVDYELDNFNPYL